MAARTVEDERDRIATIFVAPFMTCSARLPVYALLIAAFIPAGSFMGPLGQRTAVLIGLYALGLVAALGHGGHPQGHAARGPLRPVRDGTAAVSLAHPAVDRQTRLLDRTKIFLRRAGKIILTVTMVLWVLTQFPRTPAGCGSARDRRPAPWDRSAR